MSVRIARRIGCGSPSHADITRCKSVSIGAGSGQFGTPVCRANAARHPWQKSQVQSPSVVAAILSAASNPVAPTRLDKKTFGERVEGLSHCWGLDLPRFAI